MILKSAWFLFRFGTAWAIGAVIYFFAVVITVYDGVPSLILQPFCAAIVSFLCVSLCAVLGLLLRLPHLSSIWRRGFILPTVLAITGVVLLVYSATPDQRTTHTDPETQDQFQSLGGVAIPGYFALLFSVANWPSFLPRQ